MNDLAPTATRYRIDPTQDQYLKGPQGTRVFIPAFGLVNERMKYQKDSATVTLREFYSPTDFLRGGLTTTSDKRLLQTGGTIELQAYTDAGEDLFVSPNQTVGVFMPQDSLIADMSWFSGQVRGNGDINWQIEEKNLEYYVRDLTTVTMQPMRMINDYEGVALTYEFKEEEGSLATYLEEHPPFEDEELLALPRQIGDVVFRFRLDEAGKMRNVVMEGSTGDAATNRKLKTYVEQLPAFKRATASDPNDPNRMLALGFDIEVTVVQDTILPEDVDQERVLLGNQEEKLTFYAFDEVVNSNPVFAIFGINQLGWINCDRFARTQRLTTLAVQLEGIDKMRVMVYLPEYSGWMGAARGTMSYSEWTALKEGALPSVYLNNLPIGASAILVVLRVEDGNTEYGISRFNQLQRGQTVTAMEFKPFSVNEFSAALRS